MPGKKWKDLNKEEKKAAYSRLVDERRFLEAELDRLKKVHKAALAKARDASYEKGFKVCANLAAKKGVEIKYRPKSKSKPKPKPRTRDATMCMDSEDEDEDEDEGSDITVESLKEERSRAPALPSVDEED